MGILAWILFGLVVGFIAKLLMPGRDPGGFIVTMLLGIAGALVGGFIGRAMGFYGPNESAGWLMSILGAVILLLLYRVAIRRQSLKTVYPRARAADLAPRVPGTRSPSEHRTCPSPSLLPSDRCLPADRRLSSSSGERHEGLVTYRMCRCARHGRRDRTGACPDG